MSLPDGYEAVIGLEMIDDRNLTVPTYNEAVAEDIYSNLSAYAELFSTWLAAMEQRVKSQESNG